MTDIPKIAEDLFNALVTIPAPEEWPDYISSPLVAHDLYSFYYGLKIGFQLSSAVRERDFNPSGD